MACHPYITPSLTPSLTPHLTLVKPTKYSIITTPPHLLPKIAAQCMSIGHLAASSLVQDRGGNASVSDTASLQLKVLVIISLKCCVDHTTQTYSCKTTITALSSNKRLVCTRLVASVDLGNMDLAIT